MTQKHLTEQKFSDLDLIDSLKQGISDAGFEYCTPIQAASLPIALTGKDVAGQAQTGTGKTVAFLLACCQQLINNPAPSTRQPTNTRALILAPTRELAIQIYKDAEVLASHTELKLGLVYGGTGYDEQKQMLAKGADILIGTPGRLIDFYKQNLYDLKLAQVVVLDEADRMFDLGFIQDIRYLLRRMPRPEERLNMLFSATLSFRVMELAYEHMNNPQEIKINADTRVADQIEEYCYYPSDDEKSTLLINLLLRDKPDRVLVFVNTKYAADEVSRTLTANGVSNAALSGDVPQRKRESLLDGFKGGKYQVLVATDVAARGLHIPSVGQVFNYDLPQDADDYIHRIGRTARAGQSGEAISFICERYAYSIMEIETFIGHPIPQKEIEAELLMPIKKVAKQHRGRYSSPHSSSNKPKERKTMPNKSELNDNKVSADSSTDSPPKVEQPVADDQLATFQADVSQEAPDQNNDMPDEVTRSVAEQSSDAPPSVSQQADSVEVDSIEVDSVEVDSVQADSIEDAQPIAKEEQAPPMPSPVSNDEPMEETKMEETEIPEKVDLQTDKKTRPASALPKTRFSRRFGEIPLVG